MSGTLVGTYVYNVKRQRTRKVANGRTTVYHYGLDGELLVETDERGNLLRRYVYADGVPIAQIDTVMRSGRPMPERVPRERLPANATTERLVFLHTDNLGTPRLATDANGVKVWGWEGEACGATQPTGNIVMNLRFPGQVADEETGLFYNYHRYFDPKTCRYTQPDLVGVVPGVGNSPGVPKGITKAMRSVPINIRLQSGLNHPFAYVGANPLVRKDPLGLDWTYDPFTGTLTQIGPGGNIVGVWPGVSGPHGAGALPPGTYTLPSGPSLVPPEHKKQASYCDKVNNCWWQPIIPNFPTTRTGLGIHPDGGAFGTLGCIGASDFDTSSLFEALTNDQGPLTVR